MGHHRDDVVRTALDVLDRHGLADLTMRRLGAELDVRPSALYHHFASKQVLLAAVADEILRRGARSRTPGPWAEQARATCTELREAMLAYRDGADLVATVHAFGLGALAPYDELVATLRGAGCGEELARTAARTLLHFVFGHAADEQTHLQAGSAGAIPDDPRDGSDFGVGLSLVLDGIAVRLRATAGTPAPG